MELRNPRSFRFRGRDCRRSAEVGGALEEVGLKSEADEVIRREEPRIDNPLIPAQ